MSRLDEIAEYPDVNDVRWLLELVRDLAEATDSLKWAAQTREERNALDELLRRVRK